MKGKNASDAAPHRGHSLPPRVRSHAPLRLQESTRSPGPCRVPTVAQPLSASRIALDLGERSARHANSRSRRVASSAASPATSGPVLRVVALSLQAVSFPGRVRHRKWGGTRWPRGQSSGRTSRRSSSSRAESPAPRAQVGSHNHLGEDALDGLSRRRHRAVSSNHAAVCGQRVASAPRVSVRNRSAAPGVATAIPQGLLCLITATAGSSKS